jgi:hypothetical protein
VTHFHFYLGNHNELGQTTLEDPCAIISAQLAAVGHTVSRTDQVFTGDCVTSDIINVVFEGWIGQAAVDEMARAHALGGRFLIVATEEPTERGFNHGLDKSMAMRQEAFPHVARVAEAIWCLVPGTEGWYGQYAPACALELGWARSLERRHPGEPNYEFSFFGSITRRRASILKNLARRYLGPRAVCGTQFSKQARRDEQMSRGKVVLQIRAHEEMGLVSSSRCNTSLHIGRPVVAEPHARDSIWKEIVHFSPSLDAFYSDALTMRCMWRALHERQMRLFREALSPEQTVGRALREVGLAKTRVRVAA